MTIAQCKAARQRMDNDPRWRRKATKDSNARAAKRARAQARALREGRSFGYSKK